MPPRRLLACASLVAVLATAALPAHALSQITDDANPSPSREGIIAVPLPPAEGAPAPVAAPAPGEGEAGTPADDNAVDPDAPSLAPTPALPPARILYNEDELPAPVRDLRRRLIEVARTGDVEKLRPYIQTGADATTLSTVEIDGDPIQILKDASGDGQGVELLAILLETLQAGHVHLDTDGDDEIYVWPYFTQVDLAKLTKVQLVELFELVTAGDYDRMLANGSYDFYRVGISPEGRLEFFVAGD